MREPVLSCDFSRAADDSLRFATAGSDKSVKLWRLVPPASIDEPMRVAYLASLERHALPVNVVRFSPDGSRIASGSDDGFVMIWHKNDNTDSASTASTALAMDTDSAATTATTTAAAASTTTATTPNSTNSSTSTTLDNASRDDGAVESWSVEKVLCATSSIYDLTWSPSGDCVAAGCIDHKTVVWEIATGHELLSNRDHAHYVQGVAWDPASRLIATQSADRSLLLYDAQSAIAVAKEPPTGSVTKAQIKKFAFPPVRKLHDWHGETYNAPDAAPLAAVDGAVVAAAAAAEPVLGEKKRRLLLAEHDNISFFRRLAFTPDASMLLVPAGRRATTVQGRRRRRRRCRRRRQRRQQRAVVLRPGVQDVDAAQSGGAFAVSESPAGGGAHVPGVLGAARRRRRSAAARRV